MPPTRNARVFSSAAIGAAGLLIAGSATAALAQQYQHAIGNAEEERSEWIIETAGGGYAAAGMRFDGSSSDCDVYVMLMDSNGALIWDFVYDATSCEVASRIMEIPDGTGYAVSGEIQSGSDGYGEYLLRLDPTGGLMWAKAYVGTAFAGGEARTALDIVNANEFMLAGRFQNIGIVDQAPILTRLNSNGDPLWQKFYIDTRFGSNAFGSFSDVRTLPDSDGGFLAVGYTSPSANGDRDSLMMRVDGVGNVVWAKTYGQVGYYDWARRVELAANGDYIVTGFAKSIGEGGGTYIMRTDSAGNLIWYNTYQFFNGSDSIHETPDGDIVVAGTTSGQTGSIDASLMLTDSIGGFLWSWGYGDNTGPQEYGEAVTLTADGGFKLIGWTNGFGAGSFDFYAVKTDGAGVSTCYEYPFMPDLAEDLPPVEDVQFEVREWQGWSFVDTTTTPAGSLETDICNSGCDLELFTADTCPGVMTFNVSGATPGGTVAFAYAFGTGAFTIPGGPCAGTTLGLNASVVLGGLSVADALGNASFTATVPAGACGNVWLQAVDVSTCCTSNVIGI